MVATIQSSESIHSYMTSQQLVVTIPAEEVGRLRLVNFWKVPVSEMDFDSRGEAQLNHKNLSAGLYWLEIFLGGKTIVQKLIKDSACGGITLSEQEII